MNSAGGLDDDEGNLPAPGEGVGIVPCVPGEGVGYAQSGARECMQPQLYLMKPLMKLQYETTGSSPLLAGTLARGVVEGYD